MHTVDRLGRSGTDSTDREGLWRLTEGAVITGRLTRDGGLHVAFGPSGPGLQNGFVEEQTNLVDVRSGFSVIQGVEDQIKRVKPGQWEHIGLIDGVLVRHQLRVVEVEPGDSLNSSGGFRLFDVLMSEKELTVQVG
ncbi:hypothetical protein WICPIJ_004125 [Wickerhamomyces pijperi]|uniref:Uncharacterized protein n=1 Tax=Wickerhamomyces pijperi TaxID=599730 RepID=A0A9P8TN25_WICPI|nr:hypothetical protein WICPIJ_004125 [Wickerhamomyces pijperi]